MQVANGVASANELPSCEARPGRCVNNSAAAGKLQGGELREDCVEGRRRMSRWRMFGGCVKVLIQKLCAISMKRSLE